MAGIDVGPAVAAAWMEDFTELAPARDLPGHVCVHLGPADSGRSAIRPNLLRRAAGVVKDLHDQMPGQSIGVLVRRNVVVGHLMNALGEIGVPASGEGGTFLTDTPPANAILSLLRLADHPGDRAARYHVASTPLGEVVGLRDWTDAGAARANLALLFSIFGHHELAVETWRKVAWGERAGVGEGTTQYYLGRALEELGREEEAVGCYRKAAASGSTTFHDEGPRVAPAAADRLADLGQAAERPSAP